MKTPVGLIIISGVILLTVISCKNSTESESTAVPVFTATPVNITGPYNATNQTYGDIKFVTPVIQPFGVNLGDSLSPAIVYYTVPNAPVRGVTKGVVDTIIYNQDNGDYTIRVTCLPGSAYTVFYGHVVDVQVLKSSVVNPWDTIGQAGTWNSTTRRTCLQINYVNGNNTRAYCPLNFGDTSFVQQHRRLLVQYNALDFQPSYDTLCISGPISPQQ